MRPFLFHDPHVGGVLLGFAAAVFCFAPTSLQSGKRVGDHLTPEENEILEHFSLAYLDDGHGNLLKTIEISGVNVRIVNGTGATSGDPVHPTSGGLSHSNGLGNLIVGYNEHRGDGSDDRTGSHNLIVGALHNYLGFGGLVAGRRNASEQAFASVSGGSDNTARGASSSVTGGFLNLALGIDTSISGGSYNTAHGGSIGGGSFNTTTGQDSSVTGGMNNTASGYGASVSGGSANTASAIGAVVSGGSNNTASGLFATASGGYRRTAPDVDDWVAGSLLQDN